MTCGSWRASPRTDSSAPRAGPPLAPCDIPSSPLRLKPSLSLWASATPYGPTPTLSLVLASLEKTDKSTALSTTCRFCRVIRLWVEDDKLTVNATWRNFTRFHAILCGSTRFYAHWRDFTRVEVNSRDLTQFGAIWLDLKWLHAISSDLKRLDTVSSDLKRLDVIWSDLKRFNIFLHVLTRFHACWRDLARDLKQFHAIRHDFMRFQAIDPKRFGRIWRDLTGFPAICLGLKRLHMISCNIARSGPTLRLLTRFHAVWCDSPRFDSIWNAYTQLQVILSYCTWF